jgi:TatD DNase family protein
MLVDTHCHLDAGEFDSDRDAMLESSRRAGVGAFVVPAIGVGHFPPVLAMADENEDVWFALGIHPLLVDRAGDDDLGRVRRAVEAARSHPRFVGLGEIGLDYFVPGLDRERQGRFFVEQLRIAREFELPVIMHVRRSVDAVAKELRRFRPVSGIAHAFNGSEQQARQLLDLGMALGFGGAMTFTRARNIRRLAASLPIEGIVLETDAPDISPAWLHPGRNSPAELPGIARVLAELRGLGEDEVAKATAGNAARVLPALARVAEPVALSAPTPPSRRTRRPPGSPAR